MALPKFQHGLQNYMHNRQKFCCPQSHWQHWLQYIWSLTLPSISCCLQRLVTARSSPSTLPTNQGGSILKHFTLLIGMQDQGQANWCLQGRDWHSSSWTLLCLPQCLGIIRWFGPLTTVALDAKSSRENTGTCLPMPQSSGIAQEGIDESPGHNLDSTQPAEPFGQFSRRSFESCGRHFRAHFFI